MRFATQARFTVSLLTILLTGNGCALKIHGSSNALLSSPDHLSLSGPALLASHVCTGPFTITSKDSSDNAWPVLSSTVISLAGELSGGFYSDLACQNSTSNATIVAGASSASFYYKNNLAENPVLAAGVAGAIPGAMNVSVRMIAMGDSHGCLAFNGIVKCWGLSTSGQLGNGPSGNEVSPTQVNAFSSGVTAVSAGGANTCTIVSGAAWCWGDNTYGQLGNGATGGTSNVPVAVSGLTSGVTAISAGVSHTCAIANSAAYCWGDNVLGELGTGATGGVSNVPVAVAGLTSGVTFISVGNDHTCAVMNGATYCWGHNDYAPGSSPLGYVSGLGAVPNPGIVTNLNANSIWVQVAGFHGCAIMKDSSVWCWGNQDTSSNIGDNNLASTYVPTQIIASGVTAVAIGQSNDPGNCLVQNGAAYCWGQNTYGNIGDNSTTIRAVPTQVVGLTSGVVGISTGEDHACALMGSGQVYCWGQGTSGQLGNGLLSNSLVPVLAGPF